MPVLEATLNPAYYMGIALFLIVIAMAVLRQREVNAISRRFPRDQIKLVAFAVTFYGVESKNKRPLKTQGALILTNDVLAFQSRIGDKGFDLPLSSITAIGTTDTFCGKNLYQTVVSLGINGEEGADDRVAYRIPRPAKWVSALRSVVSLG